MENLYRKPRVSQKTLSRHAENIEVLFEIVRVEGSKITGRCRQRYRLLSEQRHDSSVRQIQTSDGD